MFKLRIVNSEPAVYFPVTFDAPQDAAERMRHLNGIARNSGDSTRYRMEQIKDNSDDSWIAREQERMVNGTYTPAPWVNESWYRDSEFVNHFVHLSQKQNGKIAFTETPEKGLRDLQTPMRAGAYLRKYFSNVLDHPTISYWAGKVSSDSVNYEIARTTDEIVNVYLNGPRSCMGGKPLSYYESSVHPTSVYGDSDISLAYIINDGSISARALIWESEKIRSSLYGDSSYTEKLKQLLDKDGYSEGSFAGAKVRKIEEKGALVLPYFDNDEGVNYYDSNYLVIEEYSPDYYAKSGTGYADSTYRCDACGCGLHEDEYYTTEYGDGTYCEVCYNEKYFRCEDCESETDAQAGIEVKDCHGHSIQVCSNCSSNYYECEECYESCHYENTVTLEPNSVIVCLECFENGAGEECAECNDNFETNALKECDITGENVCEDCHESRIQEDRESRACGDLFEGPY